MNIDRGPGSGSLSKEDAWADGTRDAGSYSNDGRSSTRTTFYYNGSDDRPNVPLDVHQLHRDPSDRRSWDTLAKWNDGVGDPMRRSDNFEADLNRWLDTFCAILDQPDHVERSASRILDRFDFSETGRWPAEHYVIGAVSLAHDVWIQDSDRVDPSDWSVEDWIVYREDFVSLMEDLEMDHEDVWRARKKLKSSVDIRQTGSVVAEEAE